MIEPRPFDLPEAAKHISFTRDEKLKQKNKRCVKKGRRRERRALQSAAGDQTKLVAMVTGSPRLDDVMGKW